ncbi:MAG: hypothetical protein EAZ78_10040 [Oscillatoriales cyanobacterium]|nr:MAG: hypothetical protein EA000_20060 [Oscillatoriales cyanobacterium]TAD94527.1 MAG: hypothetical protein EAZ98_18980 [Oscillatoriales cyanobacterium]TAE02990.1 MAG: hypothetical protein EAZ96_14315 [Oscillatoriales cyanobacterium]TAF04151.1 MAG: hypothetical protein EAZ78_10040 [Oscillatoriales cyanobacterium]TAF38356.1 MAG: hypothetical protein EAZ68_12885 [Oscillatoriales cyanobacterium]
MSGNLGFRQSLLHFRWLLTRQNLGIATGGIKIRRVGSYKWQVKELLIPGLKLITLNLLLTLLPFYLYTPNYQFRLVNQEN